MTVALMMADQPHEFEGKPAYTVQVFDAGTGQRLGSYVLVLSGCGVQTFILPTGQRFDSRRHSIDSVLRAIVRSASPEEVAA